MYQQLEFLAGQSVGTCRGEQRGLEQDVTAGQFMGSKGQQESEAGEVTEQGLSHMERGRSMTTGQDSEHQVLQNPVLVRALLPPGLGISPALLVPVC